jgi:microcin C transport system permease protein
MNPELRKKWLKFRRDRRAWVSLFVLGGLFVAALPAEFLCNSKPLLIRFDGRFFVPAWTRYTEQDFGGTRDLEPDYASAAFRTLIGLSPHLSSRDLSGTGSADPATHSGSALLDSFDAEPGESRKGMPVAAVPAELLARFDEEPAGRAAPARAVHDPILDRFDPEPGDVPVRPQAAESGGRGSPAVRQDLLPVATRPASTRLAAPHRAWMLWPPIRHGFADIARNSRSGRDALASPFPQIIPTTGQRLPSSWIDGHWLGTDDRGRDVFARIVYGYRVSMLFGLLLAVSSTIIGVSLGGIQGFFGGWIDLIGQRVSEIWGSIPRLYLLMILSSLLARNIVMLFVILNLTSWMGIAAYLRAEFLRGRNFDYVRAARALGVGSGMIMWRHLLPNSLTPVITFFPFMITGGILALVSLDFLGLGVPSPYPSLGELLAQGQGNLQATWIIVPTFLLLSVTITLLTFVGDGVRNAFDPRKN